jgi:2-dehydropantoate 2-reductase
MNIPTLEQILVIGAGAVGGVFGAHLAKHHPNISFLLRPRTREAIEKNGLCIRSGSETCIVHPNVTSDVKDLPQPDLIILGIKAYDLPETLQQIEPLLGNTPLILTLQNGVTIEESILAKFPRAQVIGGVAFIYSKIVEPGVIDHYKRGSVVIGDLSGEVTPTVQAIAQLFANAQIPCEVSKDIRRAKWEKMCWNCAFNPLTVLLDDCIAKALDHPEMLSLIHAVVGEAAAIAKAHKVLLSDTIPDQVVKWSEEIRDIHTSMFDDWKAGHPTEIHQLNGYIVDEGRKLGIPTPVNETLTALIKGVTEKDLSPEGRIRIEGKVLQLLSFDIKALARLNDSCQVTDVSTLIPDMRGRGVRVKGLLDIATLGIGADHVTFHSQDGQYAATLSLAEAQEYGILLYELNGAPIPLDKGGPFRFLAPGLGDLCANVKGVNKIEITMGPGKDTRPAVRNC